VVNPFAIALSKAASHCQESGRAKTEFTIDRIHLRGAPRSPGTNNGELVGTTGSALGGRLARCVNRVVGPPTLGHGVHVNRARDAVLRRLRFRSLERNEAGQARSVRCAVVEVFERREIAGWVEVEAGTGPVRVDLCVNDDAVAQTLATAASGRRVYGDLVDFRFAITDLWEFTKRKDRISVRIDGKPLPIVRRGTYYRPRRDGAKSLKLLREQMAAGYVFGSDGRLRLSKNLDTDWQAAVLGLYGRVNLVLQDVLGRRAFLCYGSLLGVVRDGGFIGYDVDFDCAYVSAQPTGQAAAAELGEVALELIDRGFNVVPKRTCLAINSEQSGETKIDLYHLYWDEYGELCFAFGIAGSPYVSQGPLELRPAELAGYEVLIPVDAERLVESIYGRAWRTPDPGFRWEEDRTTRARDGIVPVEQVDEVVRANVAPVQVDQREAIRTILEAGEQFPDVVVEIGSSLGDDSVAIASTGKRVIGLERSESSVKRAVRRTASAGLAIEYRTADIDNPDLLSAVIEQVRDELGAANLAFYVRSLLRCSDRALRSTLEALESCAQAGDYLIADFRVAPQDRWPKDKSPDAKPPWTQAELLDDLNGRPQWSVVSSTQPATGDDQHTTQQPSVVVARRG
jgi:hypothetical protein